MRKLIKLSDLVLLGLTLAFLLLVIEFNSQKNAMEKTIDDYGKVMKSDIGRYLVAPNVIKVIAKDKFGNEIGSATAFHMEYKGKLRLVTNKHVCDIDREENYPIYSSRTGKRLRIIHISKTHDLCIMKPERSFGLELAENTPEPMEKVILVGHPRGLPLTIRDGRIIGYGFENFSWINDKLHMYGMISSTSYGGNSGSPVVNEQGKVIGVLFAGSPAYPTEGLIVPLTVLKRYLDQTLKL